MRTCEIYFKGELFYEHKKWGNKGRDFLSAPSICPTKNTTVKKECVAGLTTFLTMVYIVAVNPSILAVTGMDPTALFWSTAVSSAIACLPSASMEIFHLH